MCLLFALGTHCTPPASHYMHMPHARNMLTAGGRLYIWLALPSQTEPPNDMTCSFFLFLLTYLKNFEELKTGGRMDVNL